MSNLSGKVALVTGASKGIGASIAEHLAAAGASVVVNYSSSKAGADTVVERIKKAGGQAVAVGADVSKLEAIETLVEATVKAFGKIDILVNNAGIYNFAPLSSITAEIFHKQFDTNVLGLLLLTQAAVPHFPASGGSIVNISSVVAKNPAPMASVYSATKGAVDAITIALAKELGPKNIRVNSINPGMTETEGTHSAGFIGSEFQTKLVADTPLGRVGQPADIGKVVAFYASDDAAWITGEALQVSGGLR